MILMSVAEFAAQRTKDQSALEKVLRPVVTRWLEDEETYLDDLVDAIKAAFADAYHGAGGTKTPTSGHFVRQAKAALRKGGEPDAHTVDRITVWLATGILNAATIAAAKHDPEELELAWVTMHDDKVREAHRDVDGQRRAPSETYDVDGHKMRYPGDPSAPIELWINCRCTLAPVKVKTAAAALEAVMEFVSEKPWSGAASRFTPEQWKKSCVMHVCDGMEKSCHKLPIREPGGALSRAGVHAAAARIGSTDGPAEAKSAAKRALRGAYRELGEEVPDSLTAAVEGDDMPDEPTTEAEVDETEEQEVAGPVPWYGVLAPEGVRSGDGRKFAEGALTGRPVPLPLKYQKVSAAGHDGDVTVARIDRMWRHEGLIRADGVFLHTPEADDAIGLIADFGKFGVSVDADDAEMSVENEDELEFTKARVAGASIVAIPAFHEAFVALGEWPEEDQPGDDADFLGETIDMEDEEALVASVGADLAHLFKRGPGWITDPVATKRIHDYWTKPGEEGYAKIGWGTGGDFNRCRVLVGEKIATNSPEDMRFINNICAQWHHDALGIWPGEHKAAAEAEEFADEKPAPALSLVASSGGFCAPSEWFADPHLDKPTAITITDEGQVYGHLARWDTCHMQFTGVCITPPHSVTDYAYFLTGEMVTDAGRVPVGRISLGGGHAPGTLRWRPAAEHYDSTSAVVSYVTCGEDDHGIWLAGMVRPGTSEKDIMDFRASPLSGDWRKVGYNLELIAALAVNSGGYPVPRVNTYGGEQISLVAAGMLPEAEPVGQPEIERFADAVLAAMDRRKKNRERMLALAGRGERKQKMAALAARVQGD